MDFPRDILLLVLNFLEAEECVAVLDSDIFFEQPLTDPKWMDLKEARTPYFNIYNAYYGNFGFSDEFYHIKRETGLSSVDILRQLGSKASGHTYSTLRLTSFPRKYAHCIDVQEYDGAETVTVSLDRYVTDRVSKMNLSIMTSEQVVQQVDYLQKEIRIGFEENMKYFPLDHPRNKIPD